MECELKNLVEEYKENITNIDLKEKVNINFDESIKNDELKKFIYYKMLKGRKDIDACNIATEVYLTCWKWNEIMEGVVLTEKIIHQKYSRLKYEIHLNKSNETNEKVIFRGDTMNSLWSVIKQAILLSKNKHEVYQRNGINSSALTSQLKLLMPCIYEFELIERNREQFDLFSQLCHSLGNLIPLPTNTIPRGKQNLNQIRGINRKINDFWDLTLKSIYLWYKDKYSALKPILDANEFWLSSFGEGHYGWRNFVKCNYLEEFVNEYYEPNIFWDNHSFEIPLPKYENEIKEFLTFVNNAIIKRGNRIYNELNKNY